MSYAFLNRHSVPSAYSRPYTVKHQFTLAIHKSPYFIAVSVYLIADSLAGFDFQLLGEGLEPVGELDAIHHFVFSPATLLKHRPTLQAVGICLDVLALAFVLNQDSVVRCRYDKVTCADAHDWQFEFVNDVRILGLIIHNDIADGMFR